MKVGYVLRHKAQQVPGADVVAFEKKRFTYVVG